MSNRKKRALSADKHELYQASVQGVDFELDYVEKVFRDTRGRRPTMLREDFWISMPTCWTGGAATI